jgi:cell division protein FtsI (penicillin-binding protein 3)
MATERRPDPSRTTSRPLRPGPAANRRPAARRRPQPRKGFKPPIRIPLASASKRLRIVLLAMAIALSLCAGRLLQLQGFDSSAYAATSAEQLTRTLPLLPSRGDITDRNGLVLASTEAAVAVTADPVLTKPHAGLIALVLSPYLKMDQFKLFTLLTKPGTRFVYLAKKVPALTYSKLAADLSQRNLYGVFRESDPIRTYPGGSVAAPVIGYVDGQGKGRAGLEWSMNSELAGVEGKEVYESGPNGSKIPLGTSTEIPAKNGIHYQLTLDSELQWVAERRVAAQVKASHADSGFAITMNVKTGEVLAMANAPSYDAANPGAGNPHNLVTRAISNPYEPGSVEKVLTSAALIDSHTTTPETRVKIPSRLLSGGRYIKDHFVHGTLHYLMRGVIAQSSNIGTALMARQMNKQQLDDYLASFGLGAKTGIELPSESAGILPPGTMPDLTRDQMAFGQALSVTGIQEAAAISGIINGGRYNPPTVINSATDSAGNAVPVTRRPARQVVSPQTSAAVRDLMRAVVDSTNGQQHLALPNYQTGGKTGTAQRADSNCHCYRGYVTSYVAFAPLNDPQILTYVVINNPRRGGATGTGIAGPAVKDIMEFALPRYSVEPSTTHLKREPTTYKP